MGCAGGLNAIDFSRKGEAGIFVQAKRIAQIDLMQLTNEEPERMLILTKTPLANKGNASVSALCLHNPI